MALFGRFYIINEPTEKAVKKMRKKLAKQCVREVKKIIHENIDSFFIEKEAGALEELLGRRKGSMSIGWKVDLPTIKDDYGSQG